MIRRSPLATLLRYELLQVLRDRRTILIAVAAPLILYPLMIFMGRMSEGQRQEALASAVYDYAVTGPDREWGRGLLRRAAELPPSGDAGPTDAYRLEERRVDVPEPLLRAGGLDLVVHVDRSPEPEAGDSARAVGEEAAAETAGEAASEAADADSPPLFSLRYRTDSDFSRTAYEVMERRLRRIREAEREELLRSRGFPVDLERVASVEDRNLATSREEGGAVLAMIVSPLLIMLMLGGGALVASDAISGEKERGTLETLLTTAARRREIVTAKLLSIVAVGLVVTVINLLNLLFYLVLGLIEIPERFAVEVPPEVLPLLLLLFVPVVFLISSVLLLMSGYAKSYKEYQIYAIPVTFLFLIPSMAAALPGVDLRSVVSLVPLAGISVAVREVLSGEYDWAFLGLAFASTSAAAAWATSVTAGFLSRERLVTHAELERADLVGGEPLFRRHVLRWFGILWVLLLVSSLWLAGDVGIRAQVTVNLVLIFLVGSIVMMARYRLDPRKTLALRAPHPAVWLAVLVGIPAAQLTGIGVSRFADLFFPVPERLLESFGEFLLPEGLPLWQIVFFLCILPGVCEEIAFRGVLLHGMRKTLTPVRLALAVGLIFGLFHVDLFRIIPTAYIGMILTVVVLLSGSIFPAMAWHAGNNALALVSSRAGIPLEAAPPSLIAVGAAGLGVSAWILWRARRLYPDLKERRRTGRLVVEPADEESG